MKKGNKTVHMIVAYTADYAIGDEGDLVVHDKRDMQRFKELSTGSVMIMGRRTYESLPKLLPGRGHIVVSEGDPDLIEPKKDDHLVAFCRSMMEAFERANCDAFQKYSKVCVIGGQDVYFNALNWTDFIHYTEFATKCPKADTIFPFTQDELHELGFKPVEEELTFPGEDGQFDMTIGTLKRSPHFDSVDGSFSYVFPIGERNLVLMKTAVDEERIIINKIIQYRPARGTPTIEITYDSGLRQRFRFDTEEERDLAIGELDRHLTSYFANQEVA